MTANPARRPAVAQAPEIMRGLDLSADGADRGLTTGQPGAGTRLRRAPGTGFFSTFLDGGQHTAVDGELAAGEIGSARRHQERDQLRDLTGQAAVPD